MSTLVQVHQINDFINSIDNDSIKSQINFILTAGEMMLDGTPTHVLTNEYTESLSDVGLACIPEQDIDKHGYLEYTTTLPEYWESSSEPRYFGKLTDVLESCGIVSDSVMSRQDPNQIR